MIEMIAGVYGLPVNGRVIGMDKDSGPFSIAPKREAELVAAGLARYVPDGAPVGFDEQPPEDIADDIERAQEERPIEEMSAKELRELGKAYGLTFKVGMTKAAMMEAIAAAWPQPIEDEDGEEPPNFDASEAVE